MAHYSSKTLFIVAVVAGAQVLKIELEEMLGEDRMQYWPLMEELLYMETTSRGFIREWM
jgi:hypothetical protein